MVGLDRDCWSEEWSRDWCSPMLNPLAASQRELGYLKKIYGWPWFKGFLSVHGPHPSSPTTHWMSGRRWQYDPNLIIIMAPFQFGNSGNLKLVLTSCLFDSLCYFLLSPMQRCNKDICWLVTWCSRSLSMQDWSKKRLASDKQHRHERVCWFICFLSFCCRPSQTSYSFCSSMHGMKLFTISSQAVSLSLWTCPATWW